MKLLTNPDGWPVIHFEFDNGWTASVLPMSHGLSSCSSWLTKQRTSDIGPQEAFDDEVANWVNEVAKRGKAP